MTLYRCATRADLTGILDWAADEGWNPGLDDAEAFFRADPKGFFVALNASGDLIAAISVVNHSEAFAFLGLYIVLPAFRGTGVGYGLWQHAIRNAGSRVIGLDGVEAQQSNYEVSGFAHAGRTTRFTGPVSGQLAQDAQLCTAKDLPRLMSLEAEASGSEKPAYLSAWFANTPWRMTYLITDHTGQVSFCTTRKCRDGAKIGPLVAADIGTARRLIDHAATLFDGAVTLDVPETSASLTALCRAMGLQPGFNTARMYRGTFTAQSHPVFAVTSLELG